MKIKRQLHIFLLLVVLIPLVAFAMIPINRQLAVEGISFEKIIRISFLVASVIELACIIFTLHISNTISMSITFLQRSTKRLADGQVSKPLERRKNHRGTDSFPFPKQCGRSCFCGRATTSGSFPFRVFRRDGTAYRRLQGPRAGPPGF